MTGIVTGLRASLYGHDSFDWLSISISIAIVTLLLVVALFTFKGMERRFADII
jgi:ABC-type polysaccharide/polyol phosphate export permease